MSRNYHMRRNLESGIMNNTTRMALSEELERAQLSKHTLCMGATWIQDPALHGPMRTASPQGYLWPSENHKSKKMGITVTEAVPDLLKNYLNEQECWSSCNYCFHISCGVYFALLCLRSLYPKIAEMRTK